MPSPAPTDPDRLAPKPRRVLTKRHAAVVRLTHWLNAACLLFLLMSGLQIFNAHPRLYWGRYGANTDPAVIAIGSETRPAGPHGFFRVGDAQVGTTGVLGVSSVKGVPTRRAFPAWATIPSYQDLATGRRWHLFFAWLFGVNAVAYVLYGLVSRHLQRDLVPDRDQLTGRHLWHEVVDHARLRFPRGDEARRYNALQKITYLVVLFGVLPLVVLTGLSMSPGMNAAWPWLLDLFGGRQSARTLHFVGMALVVAFTVLHVFLVLVSGVWNNLRSMVSGRYAIVTDGPLRSGDRPAAPVAPSVPTPTPSAP